MTVTANPERPEPRPSRAIILGQRPFRAFWLGHVLGRLGDWTLLVGLLALVRGSDGYGAAVAPLLLARLLPRAALLPFVATLASVPPRLLPLLEFARAGLAALLLALLPAGPTWALYAAVFAGQALATLTEELRDRLLPVSASRAGLGAANRLLRLGGQWAFIGGAALGGLLVWWDARAALLLAVGAFAAAALLALGTSARWVPPTGHAAAEATGGMRAGFLIVGASAPLRVALGGCALGMGIVTSILVVLPGLLVDRLGLPLGTVGLALALTGLGNLVAVMPLLRLVSRFSIVQLTVGLIAVLACAKAAIGGSAWPLLTVLLLVAVGGAAMSVELAAATAVRRLADAPTVDVVHRAMIWFGTLGQLVGVIGGGLASRFLAWPGALAVASVVDIAALALLLLLSRGWPTPATPRADPVASARR